MKFMLSFLLLYWATSIAVAQSVPGSFLHNGLNRAYTIYVPANYNVSVAHPLVFNLHGYGSNGTQQASISKMNAIADTAGFIVVYPEGTLDASSKTHWNAMYGTGVDDVGFINALIDTVANNYHIDLRRVYSTGLSNGAIMSNTLACQLNHRFAAIAGVAGTMSVAQKNACSPAYPIPVMTIHGTADIVVPYAGNLVLLGVDAWVNHWRGHNGLNNTYTTIPFANTNLVDGSTAEYLKYETGSAYPVHLIRVNNGGHSWPGSGVVISGSTNMDFDASDEIWKFFRPYALITSSTKIAKNEGAWVRLIGRNPIQHTLNWEMEETIHCQLTLYNAVGQAILYKDGLNGKNGQIHLDHLPQGTYIAVFATTKKIKALTFVKQ